MEQPNDGQSLRAMQCGRRMFLAALILASKYLQDRNYSARAWSKISGLNTLEINMNEMTFLSAVNWKLHISEAVFQRWTDIVLKYTPSAQPPSSPSASPIFGNTTCDWRSLIPSLTPNLDIVDIRTPPSSPKDFGSSCLSDISNFISKPVSGNVFDHSQPSDEQTPTTMYKAPLRRVQPAPPLAHMAPLPTPIMTSQLNGYNTPAASARSVPLKSSSMGCAMAQAENLCTSRITLDQIKRPQLLRPAGLDAYRTGSGRRSSLARSCSSTSSPDSMVSDSSRSSRSSSISSVSSSICAPIQSNLAVQASCRNAKLLQRENSDANPKGRLQSLGTDKLPGIATWDLTNSPETYTGPLGSVPDFTNFSLGPPRVTWAQPGFTDAAAGATRGLGDFVGNRQRPSPQPRAHHASVKGRKRHRSSENLALQQNVRDLVTIRTEEDSMVLPDRTVADSFLLSSPVDLDIKAVQSPTHVSPYRLPVQKKTGRKRACCAEEAGWSKDRSQGPGIWKDIL
ncbi:MAG: hypothetical protein M1827_001128 [Pycnora praestabilis]|nr:MAG: hypothetical protein M1827_001128 [Pycnora praestabilis]